MVLEFLFSFVSMLPQSGGAGLGLLKDTTPAVDTVDEQVAREAKAVSTVLSAYVESKESGLKPYLSPDGRLRIYSDFRSREAKNVFKRAQVMVARIDNAFGDYEEQSEPLLGFLIAQREHYFALCDIIAAASPMQADFMQQSKRSTGFTIFAPGITTYFHDPSVQQEARADHSVGHNFIHLELSRRFGILPLWIREALATAAEDMTFGEVYAPWNLHGFVFSASHADWRGRNTRSQVARMKGLQDLFSYSGNPFRDDLAHLGFAFGVYTLIEEPESLKAFLEAMQELYLLNNDRGGRPNFSAETVQEMFDASFPPDFMTRFQKWWEKPPRWNAKSKKPKKSKK